MNSSITSQNPEAEASVYIDRSSQALAERLELCALRTESYTGENLAPWLKKFFNDAFALLLKAAGQNELAERQEPAGNEEPELCKLIEFWLPELEGLIPLKDGGSLTDLVICWETTLQLLLEAEMACGEHRLPEEKEWKDILYSYVYDYASELIVEEKEKSAAGKPMGTSFITALYARLLQNSQETEDGFVAACPAQVRLGLELFLGDRLKARLIELLPKTPDRDVASPAKHRPSQTKSPDRDVASPDKHRPSQAKTPDKQRPPQLSAHQKKTLTELLKKAGALGLMVLLCLSLAACGKEKKEEETIETTVANVLEYPGMVAYKAEDSDKEEHFGVMHATVLDVQDGEKDGLFVYTLRDDEDPENAWCLNSQDVGSIFCDVTGGKAVTVLFYGDIANNPDEVEFVAILDDAPYQIKSVEGSTTQNMMNSFVVRTTKGTDMTFIKDNCKVDKEALSTDGSVRILVYYAGCNSGDLYPVRIYSQPVSQR